MSIAINSNFERDQLTAVGGQTVFTYSFPTFDEKYLKVYKRGANVTPDDDTQLLTLGVNYSVTGVGEEAGGTIVLVVPATAGDIITIVGAEPIDRQSVFDDLNPLTVALNQQLNELTVMVEQVYTYWANLTPHYNFDELVSAPNPAAGQPGVRPHKLILPMLPPGYTWVGRGTIGNVPDDIIAANVANVGAGFVTADHDPQTPSIALWTGASPNVLTDSHINISGETFIPAAGVGANIVVGFGDTWGALHWPAHTTGNRPLVANNGDVYYDTSLNQFFGYLNGVWTPFSTGSASVNTTIQTITQANDFLPGEWVRIDVGTMLYVRANATTAQLAESWWMVLSATPTQFTIQEIGYVSAGVLAGLSIGEPYYLSDTVDGGMTTVEPTTNGFVSKPVFIADSATTGWIISARGIIVGGTPPLQSGSGGTNPTVITANQPGNGFNLGDVIYATSTPNVYAKAISSGTFAQADNIGVVTVVGDPVFQYQTDGDIVGVITTCDEGVVPAGSRLWLSPTNAGRCTTTKPATIGQWTAPVYQPYANNAGVITRQRPILNAAAGTASEVLIQSFDMSANPTGITAASIFGGNYTSTRIVGENIICINTAVGQYNARQLGMQIAIGDVVMTDLNYLHPMSGSLKDRFLFTAPNNEVPMWTNGNNSATTIGQKCINFELTLPGINASNVFKPFNYDVNYFSQFNIANCLTFLSSFSGGGLPMYYGSVGFNTGAITGIKFLWNNSGGRQCEFVSGTIYVYGTPI